MRHKHLLFHRTGRQGIRKFLTGALPLLVLSCAALPSFSQTHRTITVRIRLGHRADSLSIHPAMLKYDKDFAFSFTLDDGLVSDYLVALPFFSGGTVASARKGSWGSDQGGDGRSYPGLFYSDGCGHPQAFAAAIALNAKNIGAASGWLDWKQVKELYDTGWDVLNHGFGHLTGKGVDAGFEVKHNNEVVQQHAGILMKGFVLPGGREDSLSDGPYTRAAFSQGMETVQCEHFGRGIALLPVTGLARGLKLGRFFLHTSGGRMTGDSVLLAAISSGLAQGRKFWINAFTHSVGNDNLWHISLVFPEFTAFFRQLAAAYGLQGADDMWMAPTQEVYGYLLTRKRTTCSLRRRGKTVIVRINAADVPAGLRRHELTLVVQGAPIRKAKGRGCHVESYGGRDGRRLINLDW